MLSENFLAKIKVRLEEEKEIVENKIIELSQPEEGIENPDEDDLGQDATDDILQESLLAVHRNILSKIDEALFRVDKGVYGSCEICGAPISETDLEREPWAEHCAACGRK
jgi:DnaK suppressor protein